jgi:hypothetical protein
MNGEEFKTLLAAVSSCSAEQKQSIYKAIRSEIAIHDLEKHFNISAEIILGAIARAGDLTQRGVRGVIAETVFALDIVPTVIGWTDEADGIEDAYDSCLVHETTRVRVQVKMQRKEKGMPKIGSDGKFVVEVQRTRRGTAPDGTSTRPYRFGEFDLIAVCMEPSTKDWRTFMYARSSDLAPSKKDQTTIQTLQSVPTFGNDSTIWKSTLADALTLF